MRLSARPLPTPPPAQVEEVTCLNQCQRGPVARLVVDGQMVTLQEEMTAMELDRKAFNEVKSEERAEHVWGLARGLADGDIEGTPRGPPPAY